MELHEAVDKASGAMLTTTVALIQTDDGVELHDMSNTLRDGTAYEYMDQLQPLVRKWGDAVGIAMLKEIGIPPEHPTDEDHEQASAASTQVFTTTGVDICCSVFSLGYLLGDPRHDKKPHDRKTFFTAVTGDGPISRVLVRRFVKEDFLRGMYAEKLDYAANYISMVYQQLNMAHTEENIHQWAKLATSLVMYDAFQTGLRTRRLMEEDSAFDQIARNLEG